MFHRLKHEQTPSAAGTARRRRARGIRWPRSRRRRILFAGLYGVFLLGLLWLGARLYWKLHAGVPLTSTPQVWDHYYPELRASGVLDARISRSDAAIDVLMLGASTIDSSWGNIEALLTEGLSQEFGTPVRIFNLARSAHTSRDSALKYSRVRDKPFDLVLVYDGINDVRMNNCPPEVFRDDYTHCAWYRGMETRIAAGTISLPQAMLEPLANVRDTIGLGEPEENWSRYGREIKTVEPFRRNLTDIIEGAARNGSPVVLMTFAAYVPEDYSRERFEAGKLDYGAAPWMHGCPVEMWGEPDHVVAGVEAHNAVVRDLARKHEHAIFIEQSRLIPKDGEHFRDVCHFTQAGCRAFVDNLLSGLIRENRWRPSPGRTGNPAPSADDQSP